MNLSDAINAYVDSRIEEKVGGVSAGASFEFVPVTWKIKGSTNHPDIADGDLTGRVARVGNLAVLWIFATMGSNTYFGASGSPRPMWYFQLPDEYMPHFYTDSHTPGQAVETASGANIWTSDRGEDIAVAKWTKNVGSGIDGLFLVDASGEEIGPEWAAWSAGDKIRLHSIYEVPE